MNESTHYWPDEYQSVQTFGVAFDWRAEIALKLIATYGSVAAKVDSEDSSGRAKLTLQSPGELVARCFDIADLYIAEAERRGYVRPATVTDEQRAMRKAEIDSAAMDRRFPTSRMRATGTDPVPEKK